MRIKEILKNKGMTAKELAASCGLSEMGLSKILTGKSSANTSTIIKIADVLGVKCGELFDDYQADDNDSKVICPKCGYEMKIKVE